MDEALQADPANDELRYDYVKLLIGTGHLNEAAAALAPALARIPVPLQFEALQQWLNALEFVGQRPARPAGPLEKFDEMIAANKRDFGARFAKAALLMAANEWVAALDELLEIIMRDKKWDKEAPRKTFVAILELLTPPETQGRPRSQRQDRRRHRAGRPATVEQDEQAALVSSYRRKLSMALN